MKFLNIIRKYSLQDYLKEVMISNEANFAPYHNFYHTQCVVNHCYDIAKSENVSDDDIRKLIIAALFHDFNHSQGFSTDTENVEAAIEIFKECSDEDAVIDIEIENIIASTEFPYTIIDIDLTILQKIIRDADLMQLVEPTFLSANILGLAEELRVPEMEDYLPKQLKFMQGIKFYTKLAQEKWNAIKEDRFRDMDYLTKLFKDNFEIH